MSDIFRNPVIWLEVRNLSLEEEGVMVQMCRAIEGLLSENKEDGKISKVTCYGIYGYGASKGGVTVHAQGTSDGPCEGSEADVVIVGPWNIALDKRNLERVSRARRQLFITTRPGDDTGIGMERAFKKGLVMRVEVQLKDLEDGSWLNAEGLFQAGAKKGPVLRPNVICPSC